MVAEVRQFETSPETHVPVVNMRPRAVADAVHTVLSAMIEADDLPFVEQEGFIGPQGNVNDVLTKSVPRCGSGHVA